MPNRVMSILSPEETKRLGGLPAQGIAGAFDGEAQTDDTFRPNPQFVQFLHQVLRTAGPADLELQAAAREQQDGWVYILDLRAAGGSQGSALPEDIIGGFQVKAGCIVADSYWPNVRHRVFTRNGLVRLTPSLRATFVAQLSQVRSERDRCPTCRRESPARCGRGHCQTCVAAASNGTALCKTCGECFQCNGGPGGFEMCNACMH